MKTYSERFPLPIFERLYLKLNILNCSTESQVSDDSDDLRLIQEIQVGNRDAFSLIVQKYQSTIAFQMWKFSKNSLETEELVHDVFVEAYLSLKNFRSQSPFLHWLRKIAVRVGYKHLKSLNRNQVQKEKLTEHFKNKPFNSDRVDDVEASDLLKKCLALLPPKDRLVLTLIYWENCNIKEAAELTGWSQILVRVQASRARKKLSHLLKAQEENQRDS